MAQFTCKNCGKEFVGENPSVDYKCCSKSCAAVYNWKTRVDIDHDLDQEWKYEDHRWVCPYHENVGCRTRRCSSCGWNPAVEKLRNIKLGVGI